MINTPATILCIDDDANNLALMRQALAEDYHLRFALGGERGLRAIEKQKPDLILLDVQMPDIDGFEVARRLQKQANMTDVPIIFVTCAISTADEQQGFDVGGVDYIHKPISPAILRARIKTQLSMTSVNALAQSQRSAIHMLGIASQYNDNNTGAHIWRMAAYSRHLAELVGWRKEQARLLELAATMHDIGKVGIPDAILKKPGQLTSDEWEIMQRHAQIGFDILSRSQDPIFVLAAEVALHHHEKWDGSGYPVGLSGEHIPESARIVAVADVFDALSIERPYKKAWPIGKVVNTLEEMKNSHLDARFVDLFLSHLADFLAIRMHWNNREKQPSNNAQMINLYSKDRIA